MRISELRRFQRLDTPLALHILSDGYDYLLQVEHEHGLETLTDTSGRQLVFLNLGDAQERLRSLGFHRATLSQQVPHDEGVGRVDPAEQGRMPLRF